MKLVCINDVKIIFVRLTQQSQLHALMAKSTYVFTLAY